MTIPMLSSRMNASTPAPRMSLSRTTSPPFSQQSSYAPTVTPGSGQQHKMNVVTRCAIEGKAKQGEDGASVRMYLRLSIPVDSVTPGGTIPLFPEESVKILTSQVHPLDRDSVPYNFSSTVSPLLHKAARALGLPARANENFHSAFGLSPPLSSSAASSFRSQTPDMGSSEKVPTVDESYTGLILVTQYHISYVLPKSFPQKFNEGYMKSASKSRRSSISERTTAQYMAAIDLWVPYVSRPPRAPFVLSIPTPPKCLKNDIKLRIFPPSSAASSFASLSSGEEETTPWDLTSEPHVTRSSTRSSRSNSYTHFADDESSDSSISSGYSDAPGIKGTFPSAERIRIRWAKPMKTITNEGNDSRGRVGVKEVKGEMSCSVKGKMVDHANGGSEGVVMRVEYKGTCKGTWFPGVATLLGMDIGLESKGSDVSWVPGESTDWDVSGGVGYLGFNVGPTIRASNVAESRHSSIDSSTPSVVLSPASPPKGGVSRHGSSSSTSSLLRAPLPLQNVADYSFEGGSGSGSSSSPMGGTVSSLSSSMPASNITHSTNPNMRPPGSPITLHVNINDLLPPARNIFTFQIAGTVLVTPRPTLSRLHSASSHVSNKSRQAFVDRNAETESEPDEDTPAAGGGSDPIVLPRFTVLAADSESTSILVRNEVGDDQKANVEVYNSSGDIYRDAQARKTVLQRGGYTKCSDEGNRIVVRSFGAAAVNGTPTGGNRRMSLFAAAGNGGGPSVSRPRTPNGVATTPGYFGSRGSSPIAHLSKRLSSQNLRPRRDGPLMIPSVDAVVTPLRRHGTSRVPDAYAVRLTLPAPAENDSEWLEFGLAQTGGSSSSSSSTSGAPPPKVHVASASLEGVPVRFESSAILKGQPVVKQEDDDSGVPGIGGVLFGEMSGKDWESWVKVRVGDRGGGTVVVDYVVHLDSAGRDEGQASSRKGKGKAREFASFEVFLPTFAIPVGRLSVEIQNAENSDLQISSVQTNLSHQQTLTSGLKLLHYSLEDFYYPSLSLTLHPDPSGGNTSKQLGRLKALLYTTWILTLFGSLFFFLVISNLGRDLSYIRRHVPELTSRDGPVRLGIEEYEPLTITKTMYTGHWWFGDHSQTSSAVSTVIGGAGPTPAASASGSTVAPDDFPSSDWDPKPASSPSMETGLAIYPTSSTSNSLSTVVETYAIFPLQHLISIFPNLALGGMHLVWRTMWKLYHYPLDPE